MFEPRHKPTKLIRQIQGLVHHTLCALPLLMAANWNLLPPGESATPIMCSQLIQKVV